MRIRRVIYTNHLLCTRFCIKYIMCFISFNPHNLSKQRGTITISISQMRDIGLEGLGEFSRVTEVMLLNPVLDPAQSAARSSSLKQCFIQSQLSLSAGDTKEKCLQIICNELYIIGTSCPCQKKIQNYVAAANAKLYSH